MAQVNAGRVRFVGRGEYSNSTQYYVFDLVSYNGNSYYAKADTIGNLPTNTTYWQLVAEKGNIGPTGLTGNGISSIEKTSTSGLVDTYTITYTNGNTTTFDVSNGNGIDRIEKTATVGNKDTYTIYFTNGSTTTYEVSNGEVTREELEEEVDRLSMIYNAFPSTEGEVEEGSINGTAEVPFKEIGLKGNTSQESTTGKNLINVSDISDSLNNQYYKNHETGFTLEEGITYTLSFDAQVSVTPFILTVGTGEEGYVRDMYTEGGKQNGRVSITFTPTSANLENATKLFIRCPRYNSATTTTFTLKNFQLEKSSTASEYEPYTGGNPAPNPDYPYPVNVVTGDNTINITSKDALQGITLISGYIDSNDKEATATGWKHSDYIDITDCDYYIVDSNQGQNPKSIIYNANKQPIQVINLNNYLKKTYDLKSYTGAKYLRISCTEASLLTQHLIAQTDYNVNLGTLELCKIGDYQDYLYKENGIWYKYGAIGKVVLDGSDTGIQSISSYDQVLSYTGEGISFQASFSNLLTAKSSTEHLAISNYFNKAILNDRITKTNIIYSYVDGVLRIATNITNKPDFKTWLSTHNTTVYYVLKAPTITEITDATLIEQLDNLEKAYSYDTQTNISQTNQDKPFIISYEAILSLRNVLNS